VNFNSFWLLPGLHKHVVTSRIIVSLVGNRISRPTELGEGNTREQSKYVQKLSRSPDAWLTREIDTINEKHWHVGRVVRVRDREERKEILRSRRGGRKQLAHSGPGATKAVGIKLSLREDTVRTGSGIRAYLCQME
jgi:hypothetical protein